MYNADIELDDKLSSTGIEIDLKDLVSEQGLLSVKGRQVLLFIRDDNHRVEDALADCHRKEDLHDHMFVRHNNSQLINHLCREQGFI